MTNKLQGIEGVDYVVSRLNGKRYRCISQNHVKKNGLEDLDEYKILFPDDIIRCSDILDKTKKTNIDHYGVDNPMKTVEMKNKFSVLMSGENNPMFGMEGELNSFFGKTHTEESKQLISDNHADVSGENNPMFGIAGELAPCYGRTGDKHPMFGKQHTKESKESITNTLIQNHIDDPEKAKDRGKRLAQKYKDDPEMSKRHSAALQHQNYDAGEWKGYTNKNRPDIIPIDRCIQLNNRFSGSHGHHITKSVIVFIPKELHNHIHHCLRTGYNMGEMNMLALQFMNGYYDG